MQVRLDGCPACGGPLAEERVDVASLTELPARARRSRSTACGWADAPCAANKGVDSIRRWYWTTMGPQPTAWGRG
jgi:hypothetical protein